MSNSNISTFRVVTWNIGGAKFLKLPAKPTEESPRTREDFRRDLHNALTRLIHDFKPDVVLLQEIVRFGNPTEELIEIEKINKLIEIEQKNDGYYYAPCVAIDTINQSHPQKWKKYYGDNRVVPIAKINKFNNLKRFLDSKVLPESKTSIQLANQGGF